MKRTTKKIIATICVLIISTPLISCGEGNKKVPEEVTKAYIGAYLKSKDVDYKKAELDKSKIEELVAKRDYNIATILDLDEKDNESDFLKALYSALNKIECNIASSSIDNNTAKVSLDVKGINLDSIKKECLKAKLAEKKKKKTNIKEMTKFYEKSLIDNLNNVSLAESKTVELELNKNSNNGWELTDDSLTKLEAAITEKQSYERTAEDIPDSFKESIKEAS